MHIDEAQKVAQLFNRQERSIYKDPIASFEEVYDGLDSEGYHDLGAVEFTIL